MGSPLDIHLAHVNKEENARNTLKETPTEAFNQLPDCPCEEDTIKEESGFEESNELLETFHPGAESGYRSVESLSYEAPNGETKQLGQQCTYADNKLITHGPGAGTPDSISPNYSKIRHFDEDVLPTFALSNEDYQEFRPPNNGNDCEVNPPAEEDLNAEQSSAEQVIEKSTAEPMIESTTTGQLESILNEETSAGAELESILNEGNSLGEGTESLTESVSAEQELEAPTEMNSGGM